MDIDIERLSTDLDYWNEVAPDGAECFINGDFTKWDGDCEWAWTHGKWIASNFPWPLNRYVEQDGFNVTMKPTSPGWSGENLPPVGTVCECLFNDGWCKITVLAAYGKELWVGRPRGTHVVSMGLNEFRPIKTPEQIQRDELIKTLVATLGISPNVSIAAADALIAAGYHK